jgi:hypothetical protein
MVLTFSGDREVRQFPCQCCESTVDRTWGADDIGDRVTFGCRR